MLEVLSLAPVVVASRRGSGIGYMHGGSGARNDIPGVAGLPGSERSIMVWLCWSADGPDSRARPFPFPFRGATTIHMIQQRMKKRML